MIFVKIASIPVRIKQLEETIFKLLNQVDRFDVYLNNYPAIPEFLQHPKVRIFTSQEYGDRGDTGKFFQIEDVSGYVLTIDDDLIYPENYIQTMINKIDFYKRNVFICVHGNILPKHKLSSYYRDKIGVHFEVSLQKDQQVDIPGTGTLGFHTDRIKFSSDIFIMSNMTDIWLGLYAKKNNIPIICLERQHKWLSQARGEEFQHSIYKSSINNDSYQTFVINQLFYI